MKKLLDVLVSLDCKATAFEVWVCTDTRGRCHVVHIYLPRISTYPL